MSGIYYSKLSDGSEVGRWSGTSIRKGSVVTKDKQIYLGKVIDKDSLLFYKKSEGFYRFNPETQKMTTIPDSDVPPSAPIPDKRLRTRNVIVTFGGSYFLHELLLGLTEKPSETICILIGIREGLEKFFGETAIRIWFFS